MITSKQNYNIVSNFPFAANVNPDEKTISFSEGFVLDIDSPVYDNTSLLDDAGGFSIGRMVRPSNIEDVFDFTDDSKFYVKVWEDTLGFVIKAEIQDFSETETLDGTLIWENFNSETRSSQILTENIIHSNPDYELHGFDINVVAENPKVKTVYKVSGGWVSIIPIFEFVYLEDFEFEVESGGEKNVYVEVKISATDTVKMNLDNNNSASVSGGATIDVWTSDIPTLETASLTVEETGQDRLTTIPKGRTKGGTYKFLIGSITETSRIQSERGNLSVVLSQPSPVDQIRPINADIEWVES